MRPTSLMSNGGIKKSPRTKNLRSISWWLHFDPYPGANESQGVIEAYVAPLGILLRVPTLLKLLLTHHHAAGQANGNTRHVNREETQALKMVGFLLA